MTLLSGIGAMSSSDGMSVSFGKSPGDVNAIEQNSSQSPINPLTYGTPVIWFDSTNNSTITLSGSNVIQWNNLGSLGSAENALSGGGTGLTPPIIVASDAAMNNQQTISGDGLTQSMIMGTSEIISTLESYTIFFIATWKGYTSETNQDYPTPLQMIDNNGLRLQMSLCSSNGAPSFTDVCIFGDDGVSWANYRAVTGRDAINGPGHPSSPYGMLIQLDYTGTNSTSMASFSMEYNKTAQTLLSMGSAAGTTGNNSLFTPNQDTGIGIFSNINIGEIVIYSPGILAAQSLSLQNAYFAPKWGF